LASEPLVSVIVPVRDEGDSLSMLLDALAHQTLPRERFEVLIGDDGSADDSIQRVADPDLRIRVLPGPPRNAATARNRAALEAHAPVLAFTDADCIPAPTWLEAGLRALEQTDLVGGVIRSSVPERPSIWALLYMERLDQERFVGEGYAITPNLFIRREVFTRVGGFDESLRRGEDVDFVERCTASGARLEFAEDTAVEHAARQSGKVALRKIWANERWNATRRRRSGRGPTTGQALSSLPLLGQISRRRRFGLSLCLDRRRLAAYGINPRLRDDVLAIVLLYAVLPFVRCFAGLYGWVAGGRS
jgi:GT2 family glycosyltransferase